MVQSKKPSADELSALKTFAASLEPFRSIRSTMPLQYVYAFLLVAMEEGLSVSDYAKRSGVSLSVMSRHLLDIGERNRHMEEGFGLITSRPNPLELRKHELFLTTKGQAIKHKIVSQLRK